MCDPLPCLRNPGLDDNTSRSIDDKGRARCVDTGVFLYDGNAPAYIRPRFRFLPPGNGYRPFQRLLRLYFLQNLPQGSLIAVLQKIYQAQFNGILCQLPGDDVHLRLDGERNLKVTGSSHMTGGGIIRVHTPAFNLDRRNPICHSAGRARAWEVGFRRMA